MGVRFCYASISENGTIDGKAGDQSGKEVRIRSQYDFGQCYIIRCTDKKKRLRIASASRRFVDNRNIGYSQKTRLGLFNECNRLGWKIGSIENVKGCNTDCSQMAVCAVNCAFGKVVIPDATSYNICEELGKFVNFKVYKRKNLKGAKLKKGDIIGKNGHVVIVYEGGISKW